MNQNARLKTEAEKRRSRWNKAEKPYFKSCLFCCLSCKQTVQFGEAKFDMHNCPKTTKGETFFPYKFEEQQRAMKEQGKRKR